MYSPIPLPRRLGIIDLGSNSARLMVAHYAPGRAFKITDEVARRVRLSEGMAADNQLHPAAIKRALETLRMFQAFCAASGVRRIAPVATAAVRDAANQAEFLEKVQKQTGLRFRVLSGEEEARLGAVGVINSLGLRDGLVMDVGGGSAEVSEVRGGRFRRGLTAPLGAVRLTELYLANDPVKSGDVARLTDHLDTSFELVDWMTLGKDGTLVALGGTARALARIDRELREYPLGLTHGYELELSRLEKLIDRLRGLTTAERARKIPALQADRADIILAGAMTLARALRRAGAKHALVCGQGLREGLLYQEFLNHADPPVLRNLREFSVLNLCRLYGYEKMHVDHVVRLSLSLFDQLKKRHEYGEWERGLLWAAAQLHDVGTVVDYYDHHKHSAYIILSSGLPGYTHRETALIALLCLYHRKGNTSLETYGGVCERGDAERVKRLASLLRLAEYLDRSRSQTVTDLRLNVLNRKRARLRVHTRANDDAHVEIWEAQRNADLFESAFGLALTIER
jgi:exopolyphosphatase/guanosine-5'-triphosphate,3'-diphosphate pyrophosphatase